VKQIFDPKASGLTSIKILEGSEEQNRKGFLERDLT